MKKLTPEKELEFFNRAAYKLTPQINPVELAEIKKNGAFMMLQQAYVQGMADVWFELTDKIDELKKENDELKHQLHPEIDDENAEEEIEMVLPLYPDGPPPRPLI